jgi:hypothetical protein
MCYFGAALCVLFWAMGDANLLLMAPSLFISGVVLFSLGTILGHVSRIELFLKSSPIGSTDRVKTNLGDFEKLGHVEGEAMCTGCRRTVPKADLYYNKAMDVYYHPECLSRDRAG